MPVCSYLVIPKANRRPGVAAALAALPGCSVEPARNRELLILITETDDDAEEGELRRALKGLEGVQAMLLTFGELDASGVLPSMFVRENVSP